jgi:hypothetical protein
MNPHDLLSPSMVLSQRLAEHVVTGQSKRVPWPNILSRLREAFSLDAHAAPEEKEMLAMQAVSDLFALNPKLRVHKLIV